MSNLNLLQKLQIFRDKVGAVKKDGTNPHFRSKYATIESVLQTIEPVLQICKIGYYQYLDGQKLNTIIYDVENTEDRISSSIDLLLSTADMQKLGSAITYARRYSLVSIFGLEQEDDDANSTIAQSTTTTNTNTAKINKSVSKEKRGEGEPCPDCNNDLKIFYWDDPKTQTKKPYWKCTKCGARGWSVKSKEEVAIDKDIPF